jgi:hypothetical protein
MQKRQALQLYHNARDGAKTCHSMALRQRDCNEIGRGMQHMPPACRSSWNTSMYVLVLQPSTGTAISAIDSARQMIMMSGHHGAQALMRPLAGQQVVDHGKKATGPDHQAQAY